MSQLKYQAMEGLLLESHGENVTFAENWTETDPNNIDSDGDTLPDGWEASYSCNWNPGRVGINPLNGSDAFNNPDNDGYDIDRDGILQPNEAFVNYLEYHLRGDLFDDENPVDFDNLPFGFSTDLFDNVNANGQPEASYYQRAAGSYLATQNPLDMGASDPLNADSDNDGMPDGWEIWHSRWDVLQDEWTLNPLQPADRWQDADDDGMTNWEEYNAIDPLMTETDSERTSPKWFVTTQGSAYTFQAWAGIQTDLSFGSFVNSTQRNLTGITGDPNNVDTDGDGIIDGVELLFTTWNSSAQTWTLNPLMPGDGLFDSDEDGLVDLQEFALANSNPR